MKTEQSPNRDELHAIYEQGEEAVRALVMGLIEAHRRAIAALEERIAALEGQVGKDSQNSGKPPSSDGLGRRRKSERERSGKRRGGQKGHIGHRLEPVAEADVRVVHRVEV